MNAFLCGMCAALTIVAAIMGQYVVVAGMLLVAFLNAAVWIANRKERP